MSELNFLTAFVVKPGVLILTVAGIVALARRISTSWGRTLLAALVLFLVGELICGVDVYIRQGMSFVAEGGHDVMMALAFGLFLVGGFRFLNREGRCWNPACPNHPHCEIPPFDCPHAQTLSPFWGWTLIMVGVLGLILLTTDPGLFSAVLPAGWGGTLVGEYQFRRTPALVSLQQRWIPGVGAGLLLFSGCAVLLRRRLEAAVVWGAGLGAGLVGFGFLRVFLVYPFANRPVVGLFWEEITEVLFLVAFLYWLRTFGTPSPREQNFEYR